VDDVEDPLVLVVRIYVHGQQRAEVLGGKGLVGRIVGQQHRWTHEIAFAVVVFAADRDRDTGRTFRAFNRVDVLGEGTLVDQRAAEVGEFGDVTERQLSGGSPL